LIRLRRVLVLAVLFAESVLITLARSLIAFSVLVVIVHVVTYVQNVNSVAAQMVAQITALTTVYVENANLVCVALGRRAPVRYVRNAVAVV